MPPTPTKRLPAYAEIRVSIAPEAKFEEIVKTLEQVLTLPKLPGLPRGCQPCLSGLDRFVFENPAIGELRR
jgi:hypothetical protein